MLLQVANGYAGVRDVTRLPAVHDDTMQSFWLAETLKYAYMIFSPADVFDLDTYVLNTECHPLHVLKRAPSSKVRAAFNEESCFFLVIPISALWAATQAAMSS